MGGSSLVACSRVKKDADFRIRLGNKSLRKRFGKVYALRLVNLQREENVRLQKESEKTMTKILPILRVWAKKTNHPMTTWTDEEKLQINDL